MQLSDLVKSLAYVVSFNSSNVDQAFKGTAAEPNLRLKEALNAAYREEVSLGKMHGSKEAFYLTYEFTWEADAENLTIPTSLQGVQIVTILDNTNEDLGPPISKFDPTVGGIGLYTVDHETWGWYPTPSSDMTLYAIYLAQANDLSDDTDVPYLIYNDMHDMLVWSAACYLYDIKDLKVPASWMKRRDDWRLQYWKALSLGKPMIFPGVTIRNYSPDQK